MPDPMTFRLGASCRAETLAADEQDRAEAAQVLRDMDSQPACVVRSISYVRLVTFADMSSATLATS